MSEIHPSALKPNIIVRIVGVVLVLAGLPLIGLGAYLMALGGSWYYLIAGAGIVGAGVLLWRGAMTGVYVYLAVFLFTLLWALWEAGFSFWPLVPRLVAPIFLAACVLLIVPLIKQPHGRPKPARPYAFAGLGFAAAFVGFLAFMFVPHGVIRNKVDLVPGSVSTTTAAMGNDWIAYGGSTEGARYAPHDQINADNVHKLEIAWTASTGFVAEQSKQMQDQNTPIAIDGTVYQCAAKSQVTALDGSTGEIKWQFDPKAESSSWKRCRSIGYFDPGDADACGPRILVTTIDARLYALKTSDGQPCETFGQNGYADLSVGMGEMEEGMYVPNTGPFVADDKIILGARVSDNIKVNEPSGVIRAYDALTGELAWAWDLGNPDITKLPPEGESYTRGTANVWTSIAIDTDLRLVYLPLGNATPDYYGGKRRDFDDEYNSSLVAVNLDTGREVWKYRTVHHDIWDYDLPSQPALADIPDGNGGTVPAVIQTTKRGHIFVLDRRTGDPIKAVEERPVEGGDGTVEGEYYAPTQLFSTDMHVVGGEELSEKRMWGATPIDQALCRIMFKKYRYNGDFTTQSTKKTIVYPGNGGGLNWGSVTYDQKNSIMVVVDMRMPIVAQLIPREELPEDTEFTGEGGLSPQFGLPYAHTLANFMSPLGIPCLEPPWGTVSAIDLASGELVWEHPAGTSKDVTMPGLNIQTGLPVYIGMPALGGVITTAAGLTFHSGTQDYYMRAYDTTSGEVLWEGRLPTGSQATPMSYIGTDGRQYILATASGARYNPNDWSDKIVAFALPKE